MGYIILEPATGAGAYMIRGGMKGSWRPTNGLAWFTLLFITIIGPIIAGFLVALLVVAIVHIAIYLIATAIYWIPLVILSYYLCTQVSPTPDNFDVLCTTILLTFTVLGIG